VFDTQKHAGQIDGQDSVPISQIEKVCRGFVGDAGYIGEHIDSLSKFFLRGHNCRFDVALNTYIGSMENALGSRSSNLFRACGTGLSVDIRRKHFRTLLCEQQGDGFPNAHGGTGHERNAALQTHDSPRNEKVKRRKISHYAYIVQRTSTDILLTATNFSWKRDFRSWWIDRGARGGYTGLSSKASHT
jgi:hypothetical protein